MEPMEIDVEDAFTGIRLNMSVADLEHLSRTGDDTPVSGDALNFYKEM